MNTSSFNPPRRARYTPVKGKLSFPVQVLAKRRVFGRREYEIRPVGYHLTVWVTAGQNGQQLQFEEGER